MRFPDWPTLEGIGVTVNEAFAQAKARLESRIENRLYRGLSLPTPSAGLKVIQPEVDVHIANGFR